jgi:hypothetical protein
VRGPALLDNGHERVLTRGAVEEDLTMSEQQPPGNSGDEPADEASLRDDAREAALIRKVMRAQEKHREGGIDPELAVDDEEPG